MNNQKFTNVGDAVKDAMAERGFTQSMVGQKLYGVEEGGYSQSSVAERLRKADMKVSTLVQILDIIGCDLVIVDRNKASGNKWIVKEIPEEEFKSGKRKRVKKMSEEDAE